MATKLSTLTGKTKLKSFGFYLSSILYYTNRDSILSKGYQNSIYCQSFFYVSEEGLKSEYCKNRWCPLCNRIRTAELINKYAPILSKEKHLYFVTLTRPNVVADKLNDEIKCLKKILRDIFQGKVMRRYIKSGLIGIRKMECTYNRFRDDFHPHFHLIVNSKEAGEYIISQWLKRNPTAKKEAQDIKECDKSEGTFLEIFKYFTKLIAKDSKTKKFYFDPVHMDVIFTAMKGSRVFGKIGNINVSDDTDDSFNKVSEEDYDLSDIPVGYYEYEELGDKVGYYRRSTDYPLIEIDRPKIIDELRKEAEQKEKSPNRGA